MKNIDYKIILAIAILVIVVWLVFKPSKDKRELAELGKVSKAGSEDKIIKAFDRNYFAKVAKNKGIQPTALLKSYGIDAKRLLEASEALYNAKGIVNDDEELVFVVFANMPNLVALSALSFTFYHKYKLDLKSFLESFLDTKDFFKLYQIIKTKK